MAAVGATHHLVSSLDDVAWITNLRGSDVPYNPVFLAHLLIGPDNAILFVPAGKIPSELGRQLTADGIVLADYAAVKTALATLGTGDTVLIDPRRVVHSLARRDRRRGRDRVAAQSEPALQGAQDAGRTAPRARSHAAGRRRARCSS